MLSFLSIKNVHGKGELYRISEHTDIQTHRIPVTFIYGLKCFIFLGQFIQPGPMDDILKETGLVFIQYDFKTNN